MKCKMCGKEETNSTSGMCNKCSSRYWSEREYAKMEYSKGVTTNKGNPYWANRYLQILDKEEEEEYERQKQYLTKLN